MSFLNLVFLICCLSFGVEASAQSCHPIDLLGLKQFAGNLTEGSILTSWSDQSNCCKWDGVECDASSARRVIKLNLSRKGLKGSLSKSLENLEELRFLDLSHNHLVGQSLDFSRLNQLEVLDLSFNFFKGQILRQINGLESIHSINISSNSFSEDIINLSEIQTLVVLNISNNSFSGALNSNICSVSRNIRILDFSMNHFTGHLQSFDLCAPSSSLRELHLDYNFLSGELPNSLYSISSLERFSASANGFSGELSSDLSKLTNLKSLVLSGNGFSGVIPDVFGNLTRLELLLLHSNSFFGTLPQTLSLCSNLLVLDLKNNSLSGEINLDFNGLRKLCHLDLATNHFSGVLPESLSSCRELKLLSLSKNKLSGSVPESYSRLSSLVFLTLSNNSFENLSMALSVLQHCPNLSTLVLTKNFVGEEIPDNVSGFRTLTFFAMGNCGLRGHIPTWLHNCRRLQVLDLSWNRLIGRIPSWIGEMDELFYLDFSNNSLTGEIPRSLMELRSLISPSSSPFSLNASTDTTPFFVKRNLSSNGLQYNQVSSFPPSIYLSNNRINGTILPEIGRLVQLHVLDLSSNEITGIIPETISEMSNLEDLDLSNNELSGTIPSSLNKLTFLSKFSVANNHLHGAIPTGGQFLSFPSSSFEGNSGLCGKIISPCPTNNLGSNRAPPRKGLSRGNKNIIAIATSFGVAIILLLAFLLIKLTRKTQESIDEWDNEPRSRPTRSSEAFGPSKVVMFQVCELSVADLLRSTNNFNQSNIIGCGGFGLVYKADLPNGSRAAIKRLSGDCGQMEREFQAEVEALSRARHKNLVALQGYCRHGNDRMLIYSYMENGSLDYWLHECVDGTSFLTWEARLKIAQGAARGLAYLHNEPKIIHRDIKTSNILLDERFEAHLADFGLARLLQCPYDTHVTTDLVGTLGYIPPEYSQTLTATFRGDVYSFGVVLLELLTGKRPVEVRKGKNCRDLVSWVMQMRADRREIEIFDPMIWDECREIQLVDVLGVAVKCVNRDPRQRPAIDHVVSRLDAIGSDQISML